MRGVGAGKNGSGSGGEGRKREVAAYIASLTGELVLMAKRSHLPVVAYLLDMARLEAAAIERGSGGDAPERTPG